MTEFEGTYTRSAALTPNSAFAYPTEFAIDHYRPLERMTGLFDRPHFQVYGSGLPDGVTIGARQALLEWSRSDIGRWQARQTARYPSEHINLPARMTDIEDPSNTEAVIAFRKRHLALMAHDPKVRYGVHKFGSPAVDLHPVGHMAHASVALDRLLIKDGESATPKDALLIQAVRHAAALHDIGESEHPGFRLLHGNVIGDIGADVGKTAEDRILERKILEDSLHVLFDGKYSDEFIALVATLASHDMKDQADIVKRYHDLLEVNHDLNSIDTATYMGERAMNLSDTDPAHAHIMNGLALDNYARMNRGKLAERIDRLDSPLITSYAQISLEGLYQVAHARDGDQRFIAWQERTAA